MTESTINSRRYRMSASRSGNQAKEGGSTRRGVSRMLLLLSGVLLAGIGFGVLFVPESFAAANGMALPNGSDFLSEYRAPGGMLLLSGVFMVYAAARKRAMQAGLGLAALIYGSYGLSRAVGCVVDGLPSAALTQAMVLELIVGALCLVAWVVLSRGD